MKKETPRKRAGVPGRWLVFVDGMRSGIRAATGYQADVNLLIQGFILLHFIQKGAAGFGLIERQPQFLLQPAQPVVQVFDQIEGVIPDQSFPFFLGDGMYSVIPPRRLTIISGPSSAQGCTEGMNPRIGQYGSGQLSLVAHLVALRIAEGPHQRVFDPVFIDGPGVVDGHGFPCFTAIIGGEPLETGPAGDIHLGVDLGGFHTLRQFILPGQISSCGVVEVTYQVDIPEVERRSVVTHTGAEAHPYQDAIGQIGQTLFLGRNDGIPRHSPSVEYSQMR